MSIPVPVTQQRMALDQNHRRVAQSLLVLIANLKAFDAHLNSIPSGDLEGPDYGYSADEAYAISAFADKGAQYAGLFDAGGTFAAADATLLRDTTNSAAGSLVLVNQGA